MLGGHPPLTPSYRQPSPSRWGCVTLLGVSLPSHPFREPAPIRRAVPFKFPIIPPVPAQAGRTDAG